MGELFVGCLTVLWLLDAVVFPSRPNLQLPTLLRAKTRRTISGFIMIILLFGRDEVFAIMLMCDVLEKVPC